MPQKFADRVICSYGSSYVATKRHHDKYEVWHHGNMVAAVATEGHARQLLFRLVKEENRRVYRRQDTSAPA